MVSYKNGLIYTIRTGDSVYVGSTCNFNRRKQSHKGNIYNKNSDKFGRKLYKTIRDNDGEWDMKPHKQFACENKTQLTIEEERIRIELNADLNVQSCHGIDKNKAKEKHRQWLLNNPDKNKDKVKQYYEKNKEHIKERRKHHRLNNIETIKEKAKDHYDKNKEVICEKYKVKTVCECGCEVRLYGIQRHKRSAKHIKLMSKTENP
jgi:hypothetical protein